jgi:hypothetical protein
MAHSSLIPKGILGIYMITGNFCSISIVVMHTGNACSLCLLDVYTTFCEKITIFCKAMHQNLRKLVLLREYSRLFFKFYVRSYIQTFLSFRMYYLIPPPPPPPKIIFYRGRRIVGPGGPANFAEQYYQNLQSNNTKICDAI